MKKQENKYPLFVYDDCFDAVTEGPTKSAKDFITEALEYHKETKGFELAVSWAKDTALVKNRLRLFSYEALMDRWKVFVSCPQLWRWDQRVGISIGIFCKESILNKLSEILYTGEVQICDCGRIKTESKVWNEKDGTWEKTQRCLQCDINLARTITGM